MERVPAWCLALVLSSLLTVPLLHPDEAAPGPPLGPSSPECLARTVEGLFVLCSVHTMSTPALRVEHKSRVWPCSLTLEEQLIGMTPAPPTLSSATTQKGPATQSHRSRQLSDLATSTGTWQFHRPVRALTRISQENRLMKK